MTDDEIRAWQSQVRRQFDFEHLTQFLIATIKANPRCGDVDLNKSIVGKEWIIDRSRMANGDWQFISNAKTDLFELQYSPNNMESVSLSCRRLDGQHFELLKMDNQVMISP